jgi:hypothetical protein
MSEDFEYPPGSDEALVRDCLCPIIDNSHGEGYMGTDSYVIRSDCPLHGEE